MSLLKIGDWPVHHSNQHIVKTWWEPSFRTSSKTWISREAVFHLHSNFVLEDVSEPAVFPCMGIWQIKVLKDNQPKVWMHPLKWSKENQPCGKALYFFSLELGFNSRSITPLVTLRASFSCLFSEGFCRPNSGSQTITSSLEGEIGDCINRFAPSSCMNKRAPFRIHGPKRTLQQLSSLEDNQTDRRKT